MQEILESLQLDQTFVFQFVLIAILFFIFSSLYLKPVQRMLEERQRRLKDQVAGAQDLLKQVESKMAEFEKALQSSRTEAKKKHDQAVQAVKDAEEKALQQTKDQLKQEFAKKSQELYAQKTQIEKELEGLVDSLSESIAQAVLK